MMSEKTYRSRKAVNKSTLWELRRSPAHYKYLLTHPREDTQAMKLGRAVHCAILRPRSFDKEFAVIPAGIDRRTKEGREKYAAFEQNAAGKDLLTESEYSVVCDMKKAVRRCKAARELLYKTRREVPIFWTDPATDIKCKCRVDAVKEGVCVDIKTAMDAGTSAFTRDALRRGYDVQAAHYIRGLKEKYGWDRVDWYFIVIEKEPPYAVNIVRAGDGFLDRGTWQLLDLMDKLKECQDSHTWEGYGENELILPAYAEYGTEE